MPKKVLITGGAGFIGSHLAEKLLNSGDEVFVIDNLSTGSLKNIEHIKENENFHFIEGSVVDEQKIDGLLEQSDEVYHLAASVGVKLIMEKPLESIRNNIIGTDIVLNRAAKIWDKGNGKRIKVLIASTSEVCGKSEKMPFQEDADRTYGSVYNHRWTYAFSKGVDEFLALAHFSENKLPVTVVRFFNVIGPRQTGFYGMVVPTLVQQALKNKPLTVFGDGEQSRCFTDVEDVTSALIKLMAEEKAVGKVINLGSKNEVSIKELANKIKQLTNSASQVNLISYKKAYGTGYEDFRRRVPDLTEIKRIIGYEPKVSLEESIKKIIEYFNAQ